MKKKLLIAGGGYADIPLINAAKKMGYYVISSGNRPEELGHKVSDEYCPADFSSPDAMLKLATELNIDAICSCCNDFSAISSAYVAEKLALPGHDSYKTTKLLHHKDKYREFAHANSIATPKAMGFSDVNSALSAIKNFHFPIMIKPVDLTGGKGISKINQLADVKQAIESAFSISKSKRIVVEEFINGSRHGFSAFIRSGKVVFFFSDNEHYYKNPYMVSAASTPSIVDENIEKKLIHTSEKIVSLLSLKDGIFHIQYILRNNEPIIIEICRRSPGDLYINFVKLATGVDYPSWIVKAAIGGDLSKLSQARANGFYTRHCIMADRNGRVNQVTFDSSIKNKVIEEFVWWKKDDKIVDKLITKFGIVFLKFDSLQEMLDITEHLPTLIRVEIN